MHNSQLQQKLRCLAQFFDRTVKIALARFLASWSRLQFQFQLNQKWEKMVESIKLSRQPSSDSQTQPGAKIISTKGMVNICTVEIEVDHRTCNGGSANWIHQPLGLY